MLTPPVGWLPLHQVIKRMLESNSLVAGGGAVEAGLSIHLERYATTLPSK
jgi:T-complex protein 1 subunit alpha